MNDAKNSRFSPPLRKVGDVIMDAAKMGSQEISRGVDEIRYRMKKAKLIQRRKELFAELGRTLYEAHEDGLPKTVKNYVENTELIEIMGDIKQLDLEMQELS